MSEIVPLSDGLFYCAGLLEGEGSFVARVRNDTGVATISLQCSMCDVEPLEILESYLGGKINGPYHDGNPKHRQFYVWSLQSRREVVQVIEALQPLMSVRRQAQITRMLDLNCRRPKVQSDGPQHGTTSTYDRHGCRCAACTEAKKLKVRADRVRTKAERVSK